MAEPEFNLESLAPESVFMIDPDAIPLIIWKTLRLMSTLYHERTGNGNETTELETRYLGG